jgi:hypothetical protein
VFVRFCTKVYKKKKKHAYANTTLTSRCALKLDGIVISGFMLGLLMRYRNVLSGSVKAQGTSAALVKRYEHHLLLGRKNTEVKTQDLSR